MSVKASKAAHRHSIDKAKGFERIKPFAKEAPDYCVVFENDITNSEDKSDPG